MNRLAALGVAIALSLGASGCATDASMAGQRCDWPEPVVASSAQATPKHLFEGIDLHWTLARVFARLGPARREVGEFTYEWVTDDGRVFVAAAASRCGVLRRASFVDEGRPGN